MEARRTKIDKEFKPISIEITFRSAEEIEMFYSIMNFTPITNLFGLNECSRLRSALSQKDGDSPYNYENAFRKLKETMSLYRS